MDLMESSINKLLIQIMVIQNNIHLESTENTPTIISLMELAI